MEKDGAAFRFKMTDRCWGLEVSTQVALAEIRNAVCGAFSTDRQSVGVSNNFATHGRNHRGIFYWLGCSAPLFRSCS